MGPKILGMKVSTGRDESPLFYSYPDEPQAYCVPEKKWMDKPSYFEHFPERETTPQDLPDLMVHGLMDKGSFDELNSTGLIDPMLQQMYSKIQELNEKLTQLESEIDANGKTFDTTQKQMGIEVEKEHTDDPEVAEKIATDHLKELPDYYDRLKVMEDQGKRELGKEEGSGDAIMSIIAKIKGTDLASGADALKLILETVKGLGSCDQNVLKIVGKHLMGNE